MVQRIIDMFTDLVAQAPFIGIGQISQKEYEEKLLAAKQEFMQTKF